MFIDHITRKQRISKLELIVITFVWEVSALLSAALNVFKIIQLCNVQRDVIQYGENESAGCRHANMLLMPTKTHSGGAARRPWQCARLPARGAGLSSKVGRSRRVQSSSRPHTKAKGRQSPLDGAARIVRSLKILRALGWGAGRGPEPRERIFGATHTTRRCTRVPNVATRSTFAQQ